MGSRLCKDNSQNQVRVPRTLLLKTYSAGKGARVSVTATAGAEKHAWIWSAFFLTAGEVCKKEHLWTEGHITILHESLGRP